MFINENIRKMKIKKKMFCDKKISQHITTVPLHIYEHIACCKKKKVY